MAKYEVRIYETIYHDVDVEAENKDDAYDIAHKIITGETKGDYETESDGFTGNYCISEAN